MIADEARNSMTGHSTPVLFTLHHRASHQERLGGGEGWGAGMGRKKAPLGALIYC